jgi:hypothetical protein
VVDDRESSSASIGENVLAETKMVATLQMAKAA